MAQVPATRPIEEDRPGRGFPWSAVLLLVGALVLGALLNADALLRSSSAGEPGWSRDVMVAVTERLAQVAETLRLDLPRKSLDEALGRAPTTTQPPVHTITPPPSTTVPGTTSSTAPGTTSSTARTSTTVPATSPTTQPASTTTTLAGLFHPTPESPARLWVTGDSLTERFGPSLVNLTLATGVIEPRREVQYSTGLTRPDFFDWPAHLMAELDQNPTDILVFMIGANDGQPIHTEAGWIDFGTHDWNSEYRRRVATTMDLLSTRVPTVYWIGQPIARSSDYSYKMAVMDEIYRTEAELRPNIRYVDTWTLFSDPDGFYSAYLADDTGRVALMRASDGIHLTPDGGEYLAAAVLRAISDDWDLS